MFLQQLPDVIRWLLLILTGTAVGSLVNLAIYRLAAFRQRNVSPWSPPPPDHPARTRMDRIPVFGWWRLRREADAFGTGHWIRPLLIEMACGIGLAWFYHWMINGGLYGGPTIKLVAYQNEVIDHVNFGWFLFFAVLFALMTAATFIDFDEQTIPDWITVPGAVFAIVCFAVFPALRLPVVEPQMLAARIDNLNFWNPDPPVTWYQSVTGLVVAIGIVMAWCFALMPKIATFRFGLKRGVQLFFASLLQPRRKTEGSVPRVRNRQMAGETLSFFWLAVALSLFVAIVFSMGGDRWTALFNSLLGLAMGGGIVWAVRIIAGHALGVEAMGFGDVTLMCMIGAFLGWQAALLTFVIAPFTSIVVAVIQLMFTGDRRLAFGPYLCLGAAIVVIGWNWIWNDWAENGVFAVGGQFLMLVILVCLGLMAGMLGGWRQIKSRFAAPALDS